MTKPQTQKTTFKRDFEMRYGVSPETKPLSRNPDATEPNTRGDRPVCPNCGQWQNNDKIGQDESVNAFYTRGIAVCD